MDNVTLNVLSFKDDDGWTSVVLEMDLFAHGKTREKSIEEAKDLVSMQLSFAAYKDDNDLPFRAAPAEYFTMFAQIKQEILRDFNRPRQEGDYCISGIPMPEPHIIAEMQKDYVINNA